MKHVGELAITGVVLKAVTTSRIRTAQGRTYLTKRSRFSLAFVAHILQNSQGAKIAAEQRVMKAKGSWVTEDTCPKEIIEYSPLPPSTHTHPDLDVDVCLSAGEI